MTIAAFDAKQFRRGKPINALSGDESTNKYFGFNSQLGIGVIIDEPEEFTKQYIDINLNLKNSFKINSSLPFFSSTYLKEYIGLPKTIAFTDQLISEIGNHIKSIHCSYVILPPPKIPTIEIGGLKNYKKKIPTNKFIDNLGPMFSYLTAHSYLWSKNYRGISNLELYIDSFRSKQTKAWNCITHDLSPKIFTRGDECNPFISCADIITFLTDVKLYKKHLKLEPNDIKNIWSKYPFETTTQFFDKNSLEYYRWKNDDIIDFSNYLEKPTVFLAIDNIELDIYDTSEELSDQIDISSTKPRKFNRIIKKSDVYYATVNYTFQKHGCLKIFSRSEDMSLIRDGDIFIYVGANSEKIGKSLQDAYDIEVFSGKQIRKITQTNN